MAKKKFQKYLEAMKIAIKKKKIFNWIRPEIEKKVRVKNKEKRSAMRRKRMAKKKKRGY